MERALELDPRNLFILQQLAVTYVAQRRYTDASRIYDRALRIVPGDPYNSHTPGAGRTGLEGGYQAVSGHACHPDRRRSSYSPGCGQS